MVLDQRWSSHGWLCMWWLATIVYAWRCYVALMFFWLSENVVKWNTNLITGHKKWHKNHHAVIWTQTRITATQRATSWATMAVGEFAAKSHNELTYMIHTYIYISIFSTKASSVYRHCVHCTHTADSRLGCRVQWPSLTMNGMLAVCGKFRNCKVTAHWLSWVTMAAWHAAWPLLACIG